MFIPKFSFSDVFDDSLIENYTIGQQIGKGFNYFYFLLLKNII